MYRGQMRHTHVTVLRPIMIDDGMGGSTVVYDPTFPFIERYHCRIWRQRVERDRRDQANVEDTAWGIFGDDAAIAERDKVIAEDGREYIITRLWNDNDGRGRKHLEGTMRLVAP